jgi:hypothetical protein
MSDSNGIISYIWYQGLVEMSIPKIHEPSGVLQHVCPFYKLTYPLPQSIVVLYSHYLENKKPPEAHLVALSYQGNLACRIDHLAWEIIRPPTEIETYRRVSIAPESLQQA